MAKTCNVYSEINVADNEGRTPVMCALRADYLVSQPASDTRAQYLREKLHFLLRECTTENEWLKCLTQPSIGSKTSTTALMYAARGGRESFSLAVELIRNASRNDGSFAVQIGTGSFSAAEAEIGGASGDPDTTRGTSNALPTKEESEFDCELVDLALGARVLEGQHDLRAKRRGMLLAEATKSGDLSVLQKVVDAIQTVVSEAGFRSDVTPGRLRINVCLDVALGNPHTVARDTTFWSCHVYKYGVHPSGESKVSPQKPAAVSATPSRENAMNDSYTVRCRIDSCLHQSLPRALLGRRPPTLCSNPKHLMAMIPRSRRKPSTPSGVKS